MSYHATSPRTHMALRRAHLCALCQHPIAIGQKYRSWRYFHRDNDGPVGVTVHGDCEWLWREHTDPADLAEPWSEDEIGQIIAEYHTSEQDLETNCSRALDPRTAEIWRQIWRESQEGR